MEIQGIKPGDFVPALIKRGLLFFLFMNLFTIFLYALGTVREFSDSTQLLLLGLFRLFGFSLAVNGACGIAADLWLAIRRGSLRFIPGMAAYALSGLFGVLNAVFAAFIMVLAGGVGG